MNKETRQFLGITQAELAKALRVSRSTLAMAERNKRPIPARETTKLSSIFYAVMKHALKEAQPTAERKAKDEKAKNYVRVQHGYLQMRLEEESAKLVAMQKAYKQAYSFRQWFASLKNPQDDFDRQVLYLIEKKTRKTVEKNSEEKQLRLAIRLHGIQGEIRYLEELASGKGKVKAPKG